MSDIKLKPVDAVVVGMGIAGSLMCKELAQVGLSVVGLERGRMIDPQHDFAMPYAHDELRHDRRSEFTQDLSKETITFRNAPGERALPMREIGSFKLSEGVGGAGNLWGAKTFRNHPWDFETRSRTLARYGDQAMPPECTTQDWGISYEELEPYYDQFEYLYGVGGRAGNINGEIHQGGNPYEGPRSRDYPNPPSPPTQAGMLFSEAAASLGYRPYQTPTATMTQEYVNPYRLILGKCVSGGYCGGFGCAMGARAGPLSCVIPSALKHANFELRTHANVTRVLLDSTGTRAVGVLYVDARGREVEQPAELVVLAGYTFSNTRLMLLSGIGKRYDPATGSGVVGKNYSYQCLGKVSLLFEDRNFNVFMGNGALGPVIDDFNGDNFDHAGLGFFGGASVNVNCSGAPPIRYHPVPEGTPGWGAAWKRAAAHYYARSLTLSVHGACQSYRGNCLDLDPQYRDSLGLPLLRMTFDFHDNDRRMSAYITEKAVEIARAMGATIVSGTPIRGKYSIVPYQSTHNAGGVIMGDSPATSAVNKYLQSWDVHNVFVVGASAFPQNSAYNPTGTLGALTCWAADWITGTYIRRPGPLGC